MAPIQTLDMSVLTSNDTTLIENFCDQLLDNYSTQGMVKLKNHGIPDQMIDEAFEMTSRFFYLPFDEKVVIAHPPRANPNRGWVKVGQEKTYAISGIEKGAKNGGSAVLNVKESFDMGAKDDPMWHNKWPREEALQNFRAFWESFYEACHEQYTVLLRAIEQGFKRRGIDISIVDSGVNASELRLNYYPTIDITQLREGKQTRISEHTDFGMVTLLFQDSIGGLEVADHDHEGNFISVEPDSKVEILANVGDSLERLTNGYLKSISHRVTVPASLMNAQDGLLKERYSIAYFGKAERERSLRPLSPFVRDENPAKYDDITAYQWNQIKLGLSYD